VDAWEAASDPASARKDRFIMPHPVRTLSGRVFLAGALLASAVLVGPAAASAAPAAAAGPAAAKAPPVNWQPCTEEGLAGLDCATYAVPLDHDKPRGATTSIALARRRAGAPARRIGSIFLNPGGPGAAGREFPAFATALFSADVLARYDVVGFDPRGIGASDPIQCFATDEEALALLNQITGVPLTREQITTTLRANFEYTEGCKRNGGPLLTHMSTLNVARDLDLLRQAVGDRRLTYVGYSYGTLIGATYANLYPRNVGPMIIDGNVDPDQRTNHRLLNKFERAGGFETALAGFLAACDAAGPSCAFSGGARAKFDALRERLRQGPATLPDGSQVTIDDLTFYVGGQLYVVTRFPATAETLQAVYDLIIGTGTASRRAAAPNPLPRASSGRGWLPDAYSFNGNDAFFAVNCADAPLPRIPALYPAFAIAFEAAHRTFGRVEAFSEVGCANWPRVDERYAGPWNRRTAQTILVVNGTFDPATPYVFGQRMTRELGNARLLTLDGFGHTSQGSACIDGWYTRYLLNGELPPVGTRCAQDVAPFPAAG
jgi:pimeloyl-ACP methyl ester carboxylesterase